MFKKLEPTVKGKSTVEESVRCQLEVIERLDEEMSGQFVSHFGHRHKWL